MFYLIICHKYNKKGLDNQALSFNIFYLINIILN